MHLKEAIMIMSQSFKMHWINLEWERKHVLGKRDEDE